MIRKLVICFTAFAFISPALAQVETWKIDPNHSAAQFAVRHLGISTVRGEFRKVTGSANYDPSDPGKTSLSYN
jgi:polyisoprenoid-binding protein YceI